jgi:HEAT repeat protein
VLLVTIDALRADRVFARKTDGSPLAPTIASLALQGVHFARAYAQAPHSSYSIASLHTGEYLHETVSLGQGQPLDTIADVLARAGYRTAALYTNGIFFTEGERLGAYREHDFGFHRADHTDRRADDQCEAAMREIDETVRLGEPPSFLWVHFFDTHEPYGGEGSTARERYDSAVSHVDAALARLLSHARARLRNPLVVAIAADHGEEFGEHGGVYHGSTLYEEQVRVPLVVVAPGLPTRRVETAVELVDTAETLLALVAVPRATTMRGRDLRGLAFGEDREARSIFSAVNTKTMVLAGHEKLIADLRYGTNELFDLALDPNERENLADAHTDRVRALHGELVAWIDAFGRDTSGGSSVIARGRMGDRDAIPALASLALDASRSLSTRLDAIDALASFHDRLATSPLFTLLSSPITLLADRAACALGASNDPRARARLRDVVLRDEPAVRACGALALARLGDPFALESVRALVASPDERTRLDAIFALGALGSRGATSTLLEALEDDHARYAAALALGRTGDPGVIPLLERIARDDRADDVRASAAAGLAFMHDARARLQLATLAANDSAQRYAASALGRAGALGTEAEGWDARAASGGPFEQCERDDSGDKVLEVLDARWCRAQGDRVELPLHTRAESAARLMIVRARGANGPLVIERGGREIARLPIATAFTEWRVPIAAGAIGAGDAAMGLRAGGVFDIAHVVMVRR